MAPIPGREARRRDRRDMVRRQIAGRGIRGRAVLRAFLRVPREVFLPPEAAGRAYLDGPAPIGLDQTISQPFVVGLMLDALRLAPDARVLEVGTGSGYTAALLACLVRGEVISVERHEALAVGARARLRPLGLAGRVRVEVGDGSLGWPAGAPYDAIVVWAGAPAVPPALEEQLAPGGRLVAPAGPSRDAQTLYRVTLRPDGRRLREAIDSVRFVPLIGTQGW